jgi:hypothetical protein
VKDAAPSRTAEVRPRATPVLDDALAAAQARTGEDRVRDKSTVEVVDESGRNLVFLTDAVASVLVSVNQPVSALAGRGDSLLVGLAGAASTANRGVKSVTRCLHAGVRAQLTSSLGPVAVVAPVDWLPVRDDVRFAVMLQGSL